MKKMAFSFKPALAGLVLGLSLSVSPSVLAQSTDPVVIAPPQTDLARTIKNGLKEAYRAEKFGSRAYEEAQQLYYFYGERHFEPLWLSQNGSGDVAFSDNAEKIMDLFRSARSVGLKPEDYLTADLDLSNASDDPAAMARLETAFSSAAMRYAQHVHGGKLRPSDVSGYITIRPDQLDESKTLMELAKADDPVTYLQSLEPTHREYRQLKQALAKILDGTVEETVVVPDGKLLKPGMQDNRLAVLRDRLGVTPPAEDPDLYDDITVAAVEKFQESLGLLVDGVVGPATVAALNGGSATSRADIVANMERWRWMPRDMGRFMVHVNIPEFRLNIMKDGQVAYTTRVVTGKKSNQTPVFSDEIEHIVVNPYWNVPRSIRDKEIGPILTKNPGYIARNNMELLSGGKVVDASAVDWSTTSLSNFRIRQRPGSGNALGSVKFLFPNQHDVYLHDTPSKSLFSRSLRAFSHGCVRVQNPWDFATALLQGEPKVQIASLESQRGGTERWNNLERHVPVHITYFTLRVDEDGTIRSYGDVYGHNQRVIEMLGE
jgi:murein L,D-transpeptidase YcbB/YkuD